LCAFYFDAASLTVHIDDSNMHPSH
jgi:hypothetical protein